MTSKDERGPQAAECLQCPESEQEKHYRIKNEILTKVQTDIPSWKLYNENTLFRRVVEVVIAGKDPWEAIVLLIEMDAENRKRFEKLLKQWPSQIPPQL